LAVAQDELEVPALRGIHNSPSLQRAIAHGHLRLDAPIDEHVVAFATEQRTEHATTIRRMQLAVIVYCDVTEHEDKLVLNVHRVIRIFDQQRPV
jgi:hypothetical protein